jgi:hypothetical protein
MKNIWPLSDCWTILYASNLPEVRACYKFMSPYITSDFKILSRIYLGNYK